MESKYEKCESCVDGVEHYEDLGEVYEDDCSVCDGTGKIAVVLVDLENGMGYCKPCLENGKETQGYDNWEIFGKEDYHECHDCLRERTRGRSVPQEWMIDYD